MAGIAPQPPAPQPDSQQPPQPGSQGPDNLGDEEGMAPNVSPEEQDQYNQFVAASVALIYDQKPDDPQGQSAQVRPGILKLLDDDHSDLQGILKVDPAQLKQDAEQQGIDPKMFEALVAIASTAVIVIVHIMELAGDQRPATILSFMARSR